MNKLGAFSLLLLLYHCHAQAAVLQDLKLVGKSQMHWAWLKLYDIELYTSNGKYEQPTYPIAIQIKYAREISKDNLIEATILEWQKQNLSWQQQWINQLNKLWPSVLKNDVILLYSDKHKNSYFYHNQALTGTINDPQFTEHFLSIWLSPKTSEARIRQQLTGMSE